MDFNLNIGTGWGEFEERAIGRLHGIGDWHAKQAQVNSPQTRTLNLPVVRPNTIVPMIELFLK